MKNCNEMVNSLLERREQYERKKKQKRKKLTRTLTPICCICLAALLGFGAWQGGFFEKQAIETADDAVIPGVKDWYGPGEDAPLLNTDTTDSNEPETESNTVFDTETRAVVSSFGEGSFSASYKTPENGKIYFSVPLNDAMDENGNDVVYRIVMDIFCEKELLSADNEQVAEEVKRLSNDGYDICKENIHDTAYVIMTADLNQLKEFSVNGNYGYFMFLYAERIDETE